MTNEFSVKRRLIAARAPARERGAALLIAMVLVLISTLVGISVMESSGVETRLVANETYRQTVFNTAEAVAERAFNAVDAATLPVDGSIQAQIADNVDDRVDVTAEARLESVEIAVGFSSDRFQSVRYRVSATAAVPAVNATRTIHLGAAWLGTASETTR